MKRERQIITLWKTLFRTISNPTIKIPLHKSMRISKRIYKKTTHKFKNTTTTNQCSNKIENGPISCSQPKHLTGTIAFSDKISTYSNSPSPKINKRNEERKTNYYVWKTLFRTKSAPRKNTPRQTQMHHPPPMNKKLFIRS